MFSQGKEALMRKRDSQAGIRLEPLTKKLSDGIKTGENEKKEKRNKSADTRRKERREIFANDSGKSSKEADQEVKKIISRPFADQIEGRGRAMSYGNTAFRRSSPSFDSRAPPLRRSNALYGAMAAKKLTRQRTASHAERRSM
ncbi:unnamed protein product, partial [Mesorhabditis spiculigera]